MVKGSKALKLLKILSRHGHVEMYNDDNNVEKVRLTQKGCEFLEGLLWLQYERETSKDAHDDNGYITSDFYSYIMHMMEKYNGDIYLLVDFLNWFTA